MAAKPKLNVHNFPRPPLLELTPRHLMIKWNGQTIADANGLSYWVLETTHPPSRSIFELSYHKEEAGKLLCYFGDGRGGAVE